MKNTEKIVSGKKSALQIYQVERRLIVGQNRIRLHHSLQITFSLFEPLMEAVELEGEDKE